MNECGANAVCVAVDPRKGFDGVPCSDDDPIGGRGAASTIPQTTGTSMVMVADPMQGTGFNAGGQLIHKNCRPGNLLTNCITANTGSPFNCSSLTSVTPSASGVRLTSGFPSLDAVISADAAIVTLLTAR
jgi:hypothetical protein